MRHAIAAAMTRSKREIPHYYVAHTIDLEPALAWMARRNESRPIEERLVAGVVLLRAVVLALGRVPELNAHHDGENATPLADIHLGVAVSLRGGGLIAPAIVDAGKMTIDELMRAFQDLVTRARESRVRASELSTPTITVTSLGERGVEEVFPVIVPPQVAIVGFGSIVERPFVVGGSVVPRRVVRASLAADHRVSDGHRGGLFLAAVAAHLKEPEKL
jgi:pyruvate dehydrogenase E2 component (dihydrolipoamide acetyltransferase)